MCDTPPVDLSRDRTALSGKFPEDELKAGRELELRNMLHFDASELVEELPPGKYACDTVWVDEWRGDRVRSRLCVRQFKAEGLRDDLFAGTPDTFFIKYLLAKVATGYEPNNYFLTETYVESLTESTRGQRFPEQRFLEDVDSDDCGRCSLTHTENKSITHSEKACLLVSRRRQCPIERGNPLSKEWQKATTDRGNLLSKEVKS